MKSILNGGKTFEKETEKIITEKTKNGNLPTITTTEQYDLVKDKDGWRVHMGLENEKIIKELKSVAEKLEKQKKFVEAKAKYTEIQGLSSRDSEAPKKIEELDEKAAEYKKKQAYFTKIEVNNVKTKKTTSNKTVVSGEIKNKGDKTLKEVDITTFCLDKEGKVVFEKTFYPVLVLERSYSFSEQKPFKPNYIQPFGYILDDAPSEWSGKVRVEVTDLKFE